jgi:uncharacterized protein YggE
MSKRISVVAGAVGIVVALAMAGTALALAGSGNSITSATSDATLCTSSAPKLTVQGTGMASSTPNLLTVSVGIDVTDPSAQASLADDNSKASAVTAALNQGGLLDKDVQTTNLQIEPHYNSNGVITGYEVTNTLTAKLRNFSSAGSVVDALAGAAGNAVRVNSLTFSIEDPRGIEDQARTDAVHQAVSHARSMAQAAGDRLGPVCSLSDDSPVAYVSPAQTFGGAMNAASSASIPVEPGTQQTSAQVTIVYSLERPRTGS